MLKKVFSVVALVAFVVPAFGADIFAKWQTQQVVNGFTLTMTMGIEQNVTHLSNQCEYQGMKAEVSADVPSKVEGNTYSITGSVQKKTSQGGLNCELNAQPMSLTYQVTDTQLTLTANGQTLVFNRVQ